MRKWCDELKRGDQVLHVYKDAAEQTKVLLELIGWAGEDEKVLALIDQWDDGKKLPRSPVLESALEEGRLEVRSMNGKRTAGGRFHPESLIGTIEAEYGQALDEGHSSLVVVCDLSWLAADPADLEKQIIQQSTMSFSALPRNLTLIYQYKAAAFSPAQLEQLRTVHQLLLQDGEMERNFWVVSTSALGGRPRTFSGAAKGTQAPTYQDK